MTYEFVEFKEWLDTGRSPDFSSIYAVHSLMSFFVLLRHDSAVDSMDTVK